MTMTLKRIIKLVGIVAMLGVAVQSVLFAQEQSLPELRTQYEQERADLQALRRIARSLNSVDTTYVSYFPVWTVLDQTLRLKTFDAFHKRNIPFSQSDEVLVVATPDTHDVVDIQIGESRYGRLFAKTVLDRNLKQELLRPQSYASAEETPPGYRNENRNNRKSSVRPVTPDWVSANISLFGGEIRFGNDWSIVGKVGDDVLGYPFWSSGQAWLMVKYKSISLGARLPVHGGLDDFALGLRTRRLNGSTGVAGEFEVEWNAIKICSDNFTYGGIGGSFAIGELSNRRPELLTADVNNLYSIPTLLEVHYAFDYQFDHAKQLLSVRVGLGYHHVTLSKFTQLEIVRIGEPEAFAHPVAAIEYKHQRADWFKLNAEFSRMAMLSAWAELVPNFVFAEVKYATVVFRNPQPWEHASYLYGTLGFNFDF